MLPSFLRCILPFMDGTTNERIFAFSRGSMLVGLVDISTKEGDSVEPPP